MNQQLSSESILFNPASRRTIAWLTLLVYIGYPMAATAQVVADSAASAQKRPVIDTTANGIPLVQIATPNASGLSHNQYTQYNVDPSGLILNNSAGNVLTQQAGYVPGNQNLANGSARIILNEVTSTSPSFLNGYTEVAGQRAEVIIANPNGITCNGCGFINTSRGVLTTGTPVFGGSGSLDAFRVNTGAISIGTGGLNASNTSQLDLIARSVQVNGELWANDLNVIAGANEVNYANLGVQVINGDANKPAVGIDVALLGGMYANKIRLIGTEAGVGVNSHGNIATQAGDIVIDNQGMVTLAGTASAGGNLSLSSATGINVTGNLGAGIDSSGVATQGGAVAMAATGGNISNSGRIAGNTITSNSDSFINTGTLIGDNLSLSANILNNQGSSAIIASTQRLDLVIQNTLNNQDGATLYSLGDLNIGSNNVIGADGYITGRTATVNNQSATIEADNDLRISADQLINKRSVVGLEWGPEVLGAYVSGNPRYTPSYSDQQFTANTTPAAQMLAGNNMWLNANTLTNDYSTIAAGQALNVNATTVNNSGAAFLQRMTVTNGWQDIWVWGVVGGHDQCNFPSSCHWVYDWGWINQTIPYAPAPTYTTIGSANYTFAANTPPANQAVDSAALKIPANGLYTIQTQPNQPYLVITDPRFTSYQTFVSSDYMMDRLVMDPAMIQKRLGDGFYEQKLVAEQILQATGKRNLTGFSNIQTSYQALMDAALAESHDLKLIPGVALTKDQIAALRHDIVWMVAEDVKLADGSTIKALAPKVYFSQTSQMKLSPGGALIAANEISFKSGGLFDNGGQIVSDTASTLIVGDLVNRGSIQSAGAMYLQAANDISNLSGSISGQDVTIIAGRDIRNERMAKEITSSAPPTTATFNEGVFAGLAVRTTYASAGSTSATELGLEAGIISTNGLSVTAGRNITFAGANIKAGGDASLTAGSNITLDTLTTHQNSSAYGAYINSVANLGSQLDVGGNLTMQSGNDIQLTAAKVNAGNDVTLVAAGDINLNAVKNSLSSGFDSAMGFGRHYDETVVGTSINAGNNLTLVATNGADGRTDEKGSITLESAQLQSQGKTILAADANINIGSVQEQHNSVVQTSSTDSGFFTSTTTTTRDAYERSDAIGSSIKGDSIVMQAGRDLSITGSRVVADNDVTLAAVHDLNIAAATNTRAEDHYYHESTSGWQFSTSTLINDASKDVTSKSHLDGATQSLSRSLIQSNNGNLTAVAGNNFIVSGSDLRTSMEESEGNGQLNLKAGNVIAILAGADTLDQESSTVVVSKSNPWTKQTRTYTDTFSSIDTFGSRLSGSAVKMESGGDVVLQGAELNAGQDGIALDAGRDIQLLAAYNSRQSSHKETLSTDGFAMSYGMVDYTADRNKDSKAQNQSQTATLTSLKSGGDISSRSGRDTTLQASVLDAEGGIDITAGDEEQQGRLIFQGVKETSFHSEEDKHNSAAWQSQSGNGEYKETLKLASIKAGNGISLNASGGVEVDVEQPKLAPSKTRLGSLGAAAEYDRSKEHDKELTPQQALDAQLKQLAQQPGQEWIGQLAKRNDVKFNQVKLAYEHWDYSHDGLTAEAAAVIAIAVTYASAGAASGAAGSMTGATATTAAGGTVSATTAAATAAVTAGITTLASQATVTIINNKGDVGKTLEDLGKSENIKALATAMVTAGVLQQLNATLDMQKINAQSSFGQQLQKNLINAAASATVNNAINGGDFQKQLEQSLGNAFVDTAAAQGANWIGDLKVNGDLNEFTHKLAHAIAGCATGAAKSNECSSGALGAVVGEIAAEMYGGSRTNANNLDVPALQTDTVNFARLMAAVAAATAGKDVNVAAAAGGNAAENNYLNHTEASKLAALMRKKMGGRCDSACEQELAFLKLTDAERNRQLADCGGVSSTQCDQIRMDVRQAAAGLIRNETFSSDHNYNVEKQETLSLAQDSMGGVRSGDFAKGWGGALWDGVSAAATGLAKVTQALFGDEAAQQSVKDGAGAMWGYVKDPNNWPYLLGAMTPETREALAHAYETGDAHTIGEIMGGQAANMPIGGGVGSIRKVGNVIDKAGDAEVLAKVNTGRKPYSEINGSLGELNGYKQALDDGRIGVVEPGKASAPGVDYATFDPETGVVYITDAKYRSPGGSYPSSIPQSKVDVWTQQVKAEVQGWPDSPQKTVILDAISKGNVRPEIFKWPQ